MAYQHQKSMMLIPFTFRESKPKGKACDRCNQRKAMFQSICIQYKIL